MYQMYAADPRARINLGIRRRLAPLLENDINRIKLMNSLLLSMPGSPILYYGDEIGMGDNIYLGDRDGVRTPMQWRPDRNAGFSRADPQRLYLPPIMDPIYGYEAVNVEAQLREPSSLLNWTRRMLAVRHSGCARSAAASSRSCSPAIARSSPTCASTATKSSCASPTSPAPRSRSSSTLRASRGACRWRCIGRTPFPPIGDLPYLLTLPATASSGSGSPPARTFRPGTRSAGSRGTAGAGAVRRLDQLVPRPRRAVAHRAGREGARAARARGAAAISSPDDAGTRPRATPVRRVTLGDYARLGAGGSDLAGRARAGRAGRGRGAELFSAADPGLGGRRRGAVARARAADGRQGAAAGQRRRHGRRIRRRGVLPRAGGGDRRPRRNQDDEGRCFASCRPLRSSALGGDEIADLKLTLPARTQQQHDRYARASGCS